jgi:2-haloacid dehalogenase
MNTDFQFDDIQALVFDVMGTAVDWRTSIIREGEALSLKLGLRVDWPALADIWRSGYQPAMNISRSGRMGWANSDTLNRMVLDEVIPRFGLNDLSPEQLEQFNTVWHRLDPWPDVLNGLRRLKRKYLIAPLSYGNEVLLVNMAKRADLPWDCIVSAQQAQHYQSDADVYRTATALLCVQPQKLLMVSSHPKELHAAQRAGLRTAYVPRPQEYGLHHVSEPVDTTVFDLVAPDFVALADALSV